MPGYVLGNFFIYSVINAFTPGPGNILALNTVTNYGYKKGRPLYWGIFAGYYVVQVICAIFVLGVSTFFTGCAWYYEIHRRCLYFVAGSPYCVKQTNYKHCGEVSIISKRIFAAVCQCENLFIRNYCINRIYHGI